MLTFLSCHLVALTLELAELLRKGCDGTLVVFDLIVRLLSFHRHRLPLLVDALELLTRESQLLQRVKNETQAEKSEQRA
jgi:hypothetical protein